MHLGTLDDRLLVEACSSKGSNRPKICFMSCHTGQCPSIRLMKCRDQRSNVLDLLLTEPCRMTISILNARSKAWYTKRKARIDASQRNLAESKNGSQEAAVSHQVRFNCLTVMSKLHCLAGFIRDGTNPRECPIPCEPARLPTGTRQLGQHYVTSGIGNLKWSWHGRIGPY